MVGQWDPDESWSYDPLLAVEVSEIGATLISLSVPAMKPFFGKLFTSIGSTLRSRTTKNGSSMPTPSVVKQGTQDSQRTGVPSGSMMQELDEYEREESDSSTIGIVADHKGQHAA